MMTYPTDDLTPILADQPGPGVGFRQGIVREWNPITASNVIDVDGVLIPNLPILNGNEALLLQAGDVVGILTTGQATRSWTILGRLTIPGTPAAASALSAIGTVTGEVLTQDSTTSTSWVTLPGGPEVTVTVRPSGRCLVLYACQIGWSIAAPGAVGGLAALEVSGATSIPTTGTGFTDRQVRAQVEAGGAVNNTGIFGLGSMKMFSGLNAGETTFRLKYSSMFGHQIDFDNRHITAIPL